MNRLDQSSLKRHHASVTVLAANSTITATVPTLPAMITSAQALVSSLLSVGSLENTETSGKVVTKSELRKALIDITLDISAKVCLYCYSVNNTTLLDIVDYSEYQLKKMSDVNLATTCQAICDNANANIKALTATFQVTAANITSFQTTITNFTTFLSQKQVVKSGDVSIKTQIKTNLASLDALFKKIDKAVTLVRKSYPNFCTEFKNARKVEKTYTNKRSASFVAKDSKTNEGIPNVIFSLEALQSPLKAAVAPLAKKVANKKTSKKGGSIYQSLPEGEYTLTASKAGYKDVTTTFNIIAGETLKLDIKMDKADTNAIMIG